ncbi:MAG: class I SAM-dependent methyltransferase [Gemmatimonadetes bacterium]|nr:class I SAM-dependent methyltransferase [Gemmatimonadota bacterium]
MNIGLGVELAERGLVATPLLRGAIRRLCAQRLAEVEGQGGLEAFLDGVRGAPVALVPDEANAQHYEVPAEFFRLVLGPHRKYSCALWPDGVRTLAQAEAEMLALTCERAALADGQEILELGCGWGSLSLFMARRYPEARIVAVSNSRSQRAFIESVAPPNLRVITADMNAFDPGRRFDRIVSVEMFEHMRAWSTLLERVHGWLRDDGRLFVHVFCHRREAYTYETEGTDNWMGRHFFSGGIMPSFGLLPAVADRFTLERQWWLDGTHYQRTAAAWRRNLERRRGEVLDVLRAHYGGDANRWYHRWRMFFLACEELFGYAEGTEWGVGHYRLARGTPGAGGPS